MDRLTSAQKQLACKVLLDRYSRCIKASLVQDVLGAGDAAAPSRKCGAMFADLGEHCSAFMPGGAPAAEPEAGAPAAEGKGAR